MIRLCGRKKQKRAVFTGKGSPRKSLALPFGQVLGPSIETSFGLKKLRRETWWEMEGQGKQSLDPPPPRAGRPAEEHVWLEAPQPAGDTRTVASAILCPLRVSHT